MKKIIKVSYDGEFKWITSKKNIYTLLTDSLTPELFIVCKNEKNQIEETFLTYLEGKEVQIGSRKILVPQSS